MIHSTDRIELTNGYFWIWFQSPGDDETATDLDRTLAETFGDGVLGSANVLVHEVADHH